MSDYLSSIQLQEILAQLVAGGRSGTLVINSTCNHVITIALDKGQILALFYGPKRGRNAIPLIGGITGGTFRFQETLFSLNAQDLPPTSEVLMALRGGPTAQAGDSAPGGAKPGGSSGISSAHAQQLYRGLEKILLQYLGPIARMVLDDVCEASEKTSRGPEEYNRLIACLSDEIEDHQEALRFKQEASELLTNLLAR